MKSQKKIILEEHSKALEYVRYIYVFVFNFKTDDIHDACDFETKVYTHLNVCHHHSCLANVKAKSSRKSLSDGVKR